VNGEGDAKLINKGLNTFLVTTWKSL